MFGVTLLSSMVSDPALLTWLDAPSNRKGKPNENLARESMERTLTSLRDALRT